MTLDPTGSTASRANRGSSVEVIIARDNDFVNSYEGTVVAQFGSGRRCAHGRSLVPLVKTRDSG
jgi:hypothetical protein